MSCTPKTIYQETPSTSVAASVSVVDGLYPGPDVYPGPDLYPSPGAVHIGEPVTIEHETPTTTIYCDPPEV